MRRLALYCGAHFAGKEPECIKFFVAMKENKETTCTPCEENFERNIDEMVREGEAPTAKERREREQEVESAFAGTPKESK